MDATGGQAEAVSGSSTDSLSLLKSSATESLIRSLVSNLASPPSQELASASPAEALTIGVAALDGFLQANVTGPVLPSDISTAVESLFLKAWTERSPETPGLDRLRKACLRGLEVDGVAPYAHVPHLELFALAEYIFTHALASEAKSVIDVPSRDGSSSTKYSVAWMRLRIHVWHHKLLTQPSLGPGSNFTRSSQWSDVPTLAGAIIDDMENVRSQVIGDEMWAVDDGTWSREDKAQFLVEAANNYILLGQNDKAKESLKEAAETSGFLYALSGALGKRTRFQENSISQLVVLAKSGTKAPAAPDGDDDEAETAKPDALPLNNDTLLEEIQFTKEHNGDNPKTDTLSPALAELTPDDQPQLSPLDQIILLTEATMKDTFSPGDDLTASEILPFAVRVITDKSTNWQIYTQALLVRSRIELHRSRTVERGVLQMQAVADQVLTDTTAPPSQPASDSKDEADADVPAIQVTAPDHNTASAAPSVPTSFLPAPKASESAPAAIRLRYIHALSSPPRWHLEAELAYAWAGVGSLASALEIFKRLRLWAEVALCYATSAAAEDEDGRGSGGEEKAKGIIRWRLFHRTGTPEAVPDADPDSEAIDPDITLLRAASFSGPERTPPPPNAPRLWCILGDLESQPAHYTRAWDISNGRYARAQKSLGEHHLQQKDLSAARDAYRLATAVNRFSPEMWSRLGDINLRMGAFEDAAESFSRAIGTATGERGGEDARTWSNLGSALWSRYVEVEAASKDAPADEAAKNVIDEDDEEPAVQKQNSSALLAQSLAAYKKGASIAHDNWRIWDNVLTLASRMRPPSVSDMVLALTHILRIRHTEDAVDAAVLGALLQDVVLSQDKPGDVGTGVYELPRGSLLRLVWRLLEEEVVPLITTRGELWTLISRLRAWRRDYAGCIDASERAWRASVGVSGSSLGASSEAAGDWTAEEAGWTEVVRRTDELVSVLENWGPEVEGLRWRGKARSAVRSVMGRGRERWEGSEGWRTLEGIMEGLKGGRE